MESPIREERVLNHENRPPFKKASARRRPLLHERTSSKVTQEAAFNRTRGILNLRRVLDGVVNVANEKAYKRGSSLQDEKMYTSTSREKVVQRCETSPILRFPMSNTLNITQDPAGNSGDVNRQIVRKPLNGERNKEPENLKRSANENLVDPSVANEPEGLNQDVEKKEKGDPSMSNSNPTAPPLMNVLLQVPRPTSRVSWHSPSSIEFSQTSDQTPPSDAEDRPNTQLKDVIFDLPKSRVLTKERFHENKFPSRVLHGSKSYDVSRAASFEDLISKEKKIKLAEYYSHPRFNVTGGQISCELSFRKQYFSKKDKTDAIGMAVKEELQKNQNVSIRSRNTKRRSKKLLRLLLCCSGQQLSSSSSTNSDFSLKLSLSGEFLKNSGVGTNTSRSYLTNKATQTFYSEKQFSKNELQELKKPFYIPKCDKSTATVKETIELQDTGEKGVIPVHVKCSTTLSLKNKVDGQTRTIKFSDNEIIIEVAGKDTDNIGSKVERLVIEPSREYENIELPQYLEINRTKSTKDIRIRTSKMDNPYVASIPAWIWHENQIFTKNKRDTIFKKAIDHKEASNEAATEIGCHAVPEVIAEEETLHINEREELQIAENANINPNKLISCYMVDVTNDPSSSNNHRSRNEDPVNEMNRRKNKVRKDAGTQTTFKFPEGINVFCQTTDCPQRTDDPERELLYVDYERQRLVDKSLKDPQRISESGSQMVLINRPNDPDISVPPIIVNLSHATMSAFKAAAYEHELDQLKYLQRTASQLSSRQKTDADAAPKTIKWSETTSDSRTVPDSADKEKTADDRHTTSQRVTGASMKGLEDSSPKWEGQSSVKESDAHPQELLPQIITTSRPFLQLGESELVQDQTSVDAEPEVSRQINERQNEVSSSNARTSTTARGNSENTEKSQSPNNTSFPQQKQRQHKSTRKTHGLDVAEGRKLSQGKNTEFVSRRRTSLEREKIEERVKTSSLVTEPQKMPAIDSSRKASEAFINSELPKEENNVQSTSQSSFIKASNPSLLYLVNDPKLFQGKGKRERFAARAGVRTPPQRGRPGGFGRPAPPPRPPPSPPPPPAKTDPGPKKGKGPQKTPLVFGSSSESIDGPENIKPKKGGAPIKKEKSQVNAKQDKSKKDSDEEEEEEQHEITPFPVTMLRDASTSSSVSSSAAGSPSESMSSMTSPVSGGTDSSKPSVVSDPDSSDSEPGRKSSRRSRRSSARVSEPRKSGKDADVISVPIRSTIEEGAESPQGEQDKTRVSETRSSLRDSKFLPDMIVSSIDEAVAKKEETASPRASEQRSSHRGSDADARKKSHAEKRSSQPPPPPPTRSSVRDSDFVPNLILSTTDDAIKSPKERHRSSRSSGPRASEDSKSLRRSEPRPPGGSASSRASKQRVSGSEPDVLPRKISSSSHDPRKSSKMRDRPSSPRVSDKDVGVLPERSKSTSDDARKSFSSRSSVIKRSDFFPDVDVPSVEYASKSPSKHSYPRLSDRARYSAEGKPSGRSREGSSHGSRKSPYSSRSQATAPDEYLSPSSIEVTKALERKYSLPDSDDSSEETFQDTIASKSRDLVTDLPDSSAIEPSVRPRSKQWDSSDLPTTVTEIDIIPDQSESKYFAQDEDLEDEIIEHEIQEMIMQPVEELLPTVRGHVDVPCMTPHERERTSYVDPRKITRHERRHMESCQPLPQTEKSALNNMCKMFCNIFPCCRKLSVCCKRKGADARKTPSQQTKKRKGRSSKSSIASSQLCGKCDKCDSATTSLTGSPIIRQTYPPGQPDVTAGYNVTNLYGVYMLALEQSNNRGSVGVHNFAENILSRAIYPQVYDNSSSSCVLSDRKKITSKIKCSKRESSELSSNLSSKTFYNFKHISQLPSQETTFNNALCMDDDSEDTEQRMFTSTPPFTLTGTTSPPSGSEDFSSQPHERGFNSPPATPCLFDLFSSSSKKLVLSEFYRKNYRKEKSLITQTKKKFQKKLSSQVADVNYQHMKPHSRKKGNIFEEYATNSGSNFINNRNKGNAPHLLRQKWSDNHQHLIETNRDIDLDDINTRNKLLEDLTEGKVRKRRKESVNYEPYYHANEERSKRKNEEFVYRSENRNEIPSMAVVDDIDTKNVTNDLKTNLKGLYRNISPKNKNEMQYRKTKKIKEEMFKIHI